MLEFYNELEGGRGPVFLKLDHLAEETIGHLDEDAGAITRVRVRPAGTTMLEIDEQIEGLANDLMRALALDVRDETDPARVVFVARTVQPLAPLVAWLSLRSHGSPGSANVRGRRLERRRIGPY